MAPLWAGKQTLVIMCLHLLKIERGERVEGWIGYFQGQGCTGHLTRTQAHDSSLTVKEVVKHGCPLCWGRSSSIREQSSQSWPHERKEEKWGSCSSPRILKIHLPSWPGVLAKGLGWRRNVLTTRTPHHPTTQRRKGGESHNFSVGWELAWIPYPSPLGSK